MDCNNCDWKRYDWDISLPCGSNEKCPKENSDESHIVKYQPLYYLGLGYGFETFCYKIYKKDNERYIQTNCGVHRKESDVLQNKCDLFTTKEAINKRLAGSWKAKLL